MKIYGLLLFLTLMMTGCKKEQTPEPVTIHSKWELIPGHYNVYDSTGAYIYEMDITHFSGTNSYGDVDSLHFMNFDGNFNLLAIQSKASPYPLNVTIGSYTELHDSINNRWNIFGFGSDGIVNTFRNDTIVFYFEKQNTPYWWNDGTQYFNGNLKQIAVKQ